MKIAGILLTIAFCITGLSSRAQYRGNGKSFKFFNRTEVSYSFGINDVLLAEKINAFQIKTVFGKQNELFGLGVGLSTANFSALGNSSGSNYSTISFTLNTHVLPFKNGDFGNDIFVKGGAGYSPRIFNGYNKGFTYDGGLGYIFTTKKGGRFFVEAIYLQQNLEDFGNFSNLDATIKTVGLGIGIGF